MTQFYPLNNLQTYLNVIVSFLPCIFFSKYPNLLTRKHCILFKENCEMNNKQFNKAVFLSSESKKKCSVSHLIFVVFRPILLFRERWLDFKGKRGGS